MVQQQRGVWDVAEEVADGDAVGTAQVAREKCLRPSTVFRWMKKGLPAADGGRIRLEAVKRGRSWLTSRAALRRFFSNLPNNAAHDGEKSSRPIENATCKVKNELKQKFGI